MSLTLIFTGVDSVLSADFFPPIELDKASDYEVGMLSFETYNSIPNVDETNNKFHFGDGRIITVPVGTYEVIDLARFLQEAVKELSTKQNPLFLQIIPNNNTLQTFLRSTFDIDFTQPNSVGGLLGFGKIMIEANKRYMTEGVFDVFRVNSVQVECSIATGSYVNGEPAHTIYEFFPSVPAGYKIVETPSPVIYSPITTHNIDSITLRITDQDKRLIDFRGERITVRIHVRKS